MKKITIKVSVFIIITFLFIGINIFKYSDPNSPLPEFDYKGMDKREIVIHILENVLINSKSRGILMAAPPGNYIEVKNKDSILKNDYIMNQSVWDVNIVWVRNYFKGGYYFYRLKFDEKGKVYQQDILFSSDGFLGL